jgi:hypothetical protein
VIIAVEVVLGLVGAACVLAAVRSAVHATILPRATANRLASVSSIGTRTAFRLWVGRSSSYERRDRIMASVGPVALLGLLVTWLLLIMAGYSLLFLAVSTSSVARAVELSGSSVFTLGSTAPGDLAGDIVSYSEAGVGLLVVTLLITYLPSLYASFSRREMGVSLLRVRAGTPAQSTTMLIRYHRIEPEGYRLTELWRQWEQWFVDVEESHTSFPVLALFRSPLAEQSWVTAAGALLDAASLWLSTVEGPRDPDAALCLRAGFQCLRRVASGFNLLYDDDPAPDDPITIDRSEWERAVKELVDAGLEVVADRDQAWKDFQGWRVNYDSVLLMMARLVEAPPAPWVSDRSPLPPNLRPAFTTRITLRAPWSPTRSSDSRGPRRP